MSILLYPSVYIILSIHGFVVGKSLLLAKMTSWKDYRMEKTICVMYAIFFGILLLFLGLHLEHGWIIGLLTVIAGYISNMKLIIVPVITSVLGYIYGSALDINEFVAYEYMLSSINPLFAGLWTVLYANSNRKGKVEPIILGLVWLAVLFDIFLTFTIPWRIG